MVYDFDFPDAGNMSLYRTSSSSQPAPAPSASHGHQMYPRVGSQRGHAVAQQPPGRSSSYSHYAPPAVPPPSASSANLGIRVAIKPEYRITPPPQLSPHVGDIPRSNFQFDFDLERKILAEAEKENPNWGKLALENLPLRTAQPVPTPVQSPAGDPIVNKYAASGLSSEAVRLAVSKYGDNPIKVREFAKGYSLLRDMGFASSNVADALALNDNDSEKALAHILNSSS